MGLPAKLSITNSNYRGLGDDLENWETLRFSQDVPLLKGKFSVDVGRRQRTDWDKNGFPVFEGGMAFEAKYKQNLTEHTRCYARFRTYGGDKQLRFAVGASIPLNDEISMYADVHRSTAYIKQDDNTSKKVKYGGWIGLDYNPKWAKGLNIWVEPLQTNNNGEEITVSANLGTSINVHDAYNWFNK